MSMNLSLRAEVFLALNRHTDEEELFDGLLILLSEYMRAHAKVDVAATIPCPPPDFDVDIERESLESDISELPPSPYRCSYKCALCGDEEDTTCLPEDLPKQTSR